MRREYLVVRKKRKIKIYGIKHNILFGELSWGHLGTIFYNETIGEYLFDPSWTMRYMSEKLIRVVDCEIERLRKAHGKV